MQPKKEVPKTNNLLLEETRKITLKKPVQKVLGCCPMFNNTYVIVAIKSHRKEMVGHYDAQGNILREYVYDDSNLYPYVIPSDRQIVWVDNDRDLVLQWNLQTYQLLEFVFKFNNDTADSHEVFFFPETRLLCIAQWGRHDSNYFRLNYYNYPLTSNSVPVHEYESNEVWNYEHTVRRGNVRSMFTWFKSSHKQEFQFKSYQLIEKPNKTWGGKYTHHKVKNPFKAQSQSACQLSVGNVWEMIPQKFFIVSITDRPHNQKKDQYWPNALFVYQANNNLFRQAKFAFFDKFRFQYVHYYSFGNTGMIRSFDFDKGEPLQTPVYYIDNENECIAAQGKWRCSYLNKYCLPGFNANMIVDNQYENGDVKEIKSKLIKIADLKEMTVFMLQAYINKIDEDLCQAVTEMLVTSKN